MKSRQETHGFPGFCVWPERSKSGSPRPCGPKPEMLKHASLEHTSFIFRSRGPSSHQKLHAARPCPPSGHAPPMDWATISRGSTETLQRLILGPRVQKFTQLLHLPRCSQMCRLQILDPEPKSDSHSIPQEQESSRVSCQNELVILLSKIVGT